MTNRGRRARLDGIQQIAEALRDPCEAPDLSSAILARVDTRRGFLSRRARALVWVGRAAAALTIALVVLGFTLANRYSPGALQVAAQPKPVTDIISAVSTQANEQLTALKFSLEPNPGRSLEITSLLASVAPVNDLAEPIGAALHAVRFVGPPEVAANAQPLLLSADWQVVSSLGASRLPRASQSAWPAAGLREAMDDRRLLEDESPLLSGDGEGASLAPR